MNAYLTITVLITAGVALVVQNLLMVRITESVSTVLITLVINSGVGLALLLVALFFRYGTAGIAEAATAFRIWYLLPGLLGSLFVFAGIMGYRSVGAATTVSVLVATQLVAGMAADALRADAPFARISPMSVLGAVLLVSGVFLMARERV